MRDSERIVVVGCSAGGVESLIALVKGLPPELDASVFIVQHLSPNYRSALPEILSVHAPFPVKHPADGDHIEPRTIYVASPDHHLLLDNGHVLIKRGPKENRFRPSIDALFRSAAYSYGARVVGIVLSGALDDGTSGLWSIKRLGGITMVQLPTEAAFDSMPLSALSQVEIDHCLAAHDMGASLDSLQVPAQVDTSNAITVVERAGLETSIAGDGDAFRKGIMKAGELTPFTCPECHGVLVQIDEGGLLRYRCHTGHGYTRPALLSELVEKIEETYWISMRSLEEAAMLLEHTADTLSEQGNSSAAALFHEEACIATAESRELRETLLRRKRFTGENLFGEEKTD
ncbi:chemotaxis protein CheB [Kineobactrum sediminis]|uniref:protein-glutamate methylesterase n=1 Tax=Kineobactrum sediminis TaxID=1905677 RepID=A0A2N5XYR0_9GAMM|nr:chemotaxis protein CheB [Kineobactrum sediminis]PLW81287.1 chemotaxis protein CheB [Kineobactrum sediminis]